MNKDIQDLTVEEYIEILNAFNKSGKKTIAKILVYNSKYEVSIYTEELELIDLFSTYSKESLTFVLEKYNAFPVRFCNHKYSVCEELADLENKIRMNNTGYKDLVVSKIELMETKEYVEPSLVDAFINDKAKARRLAAFCNTNNIPLIVHSKSKCTKDILKQILSTMPIDMTNLFKVENEANVNVDDMKLDTFIDYALDPRIDYLNVKELAYNDHYATTSFTPDNFSVFNARFRVHDDVIGWRQKQ